MKTCPICNAKAFDDADICYGCLHRFDKEAPPMTSEQTTSHTGVMQSQMNSVAVGESMVSGAPMQKAKAVQGMAPKLEGEFLQTDATQQRNEQSQPIIARQNDGHQQVNASGKPNSSIQGSASQLNRSVASVCGTKQVEQPSFREGVSAPAFTIKFTPVPDENMGVTWRCSVEQAS